jgi:uncharacterized protein
MKVVIDTNCLLSSIPPKSVHYWLYRAFENEVFEWIVSNEILTEYEEKISDRYSDLTAELVLSILSSAPNTTFSEPYYKWQLIEQDSDDNKFADLAISSNADYLVTNDKDFNILKELDFPKVKVVSLIEFKEIIDVLI